MVTATGNEEGRAHGAPAPPGNASLLSSCALLRPVHAGDGPIPTAEVADVDRRAPARRGVDEPAPLRPAVERSFGTLRR